jgi:hypothetical protein
MGFSAVCGEAAWLTQLEVEAAMLPTGEIENPRRLDPATELAITRLSGSDGRYADAKAVYHELLDAVGPSASPLVAALVDRVDELIEARTRAAFALGVAAAKRLSREQNDGDR